MLVDPFQTHIKFGNHLKNPSLRTNSDEPISALSVRGEINAKRHKKSAASTRAHTQPPNTTPDHMEDGVDGVLPPRPGILGGPGGRGAVPPELVHLGEVREVAHRLQ